MKIAVSIPDPVYQEAEALAARLRKPRSRLYADALREYLARHSSLGITESLNQVVDSVGEQVDPFTSAAAAQILKQVEW